MQNGYSVGNLELDITALDKSATSLNNVIDRLQSMLQLVTPISAKFLTLRTDMSAISRLKFGSFERLATGLNSLSKVNTQGLYTKLNSITRILTPLQELSASMSGIGQVNTFANGLQKIVKLDVAGFDTQIKALTASLRPFLQEITVATPALTAFSTAMASLKGRRMIGFKQFDKSGGRTQNLAKTLNLAGILGKLYFIRNYTKQLGQTMSGLVQSAIDYTETLNLWQVAMRGNIDTAEEFISKMNKAYGIAEQTLMKYQATFRNMLSTLGGVSTDVSYALSEYITQMALDYASLYNTSIDKAMTVFQSVLSGQVRPIRSISGYDITETTIFELYQQLGGTKTMRQLSQTEKRLLRIYAVFQQMERSGAIGDLNKTLNNTANQMRIMSEVAQELGTWGGKFFELYIADWLPYINAALMVARDIAKAVVQSLPTYEEFDGTIAGFEETADAIDEVQGKLLDFDKFRALSSSEETNIGIDSTLISGMTRYQSILDNVTNKATKLAEQWKIASGFFDKNGAFNLAKWEQIKDDARDIFDSIKNIALLLVSKKIAGSITAMSTTFGKFGLLKGLGLSALIAGFIQLTLTSEEFRNSLLSIWYRLEAPLTALLSVFMDILNSIVPIVANVIKITDELGVLEPLIFAIIGASIGKKVYDLGSGLVGLITKIGGTNGLNKVLATLATNYELATVKQRAFALGLGAIGFSVAFFGFNELFKNLDATGKVIAGLITILGAAATAWIAYHTASSFGTAAPIILTSIGAGVAGMKAVFDGIKAYKNGGLVEDGLFTMNKGEVMGTFDDGTSIVANNQQIISGIKQGVYQAVSQAMANSGRTDDIPIDIYIDGERVFQATKKNAKRHGLAFSKV